MTRLVVTGLPSPTAALPLPPTRSDEPPFLDVGLGLSVLGFIIRRMVLSRSVIERAVRQQLADLDLDSGDFDVAAIVEAFEASVDDERDIQVDDGGGQGDPFAVNTRVGQVIADEWGSERLAQLRIGVHLNRTWHEIDTIGYPPTTPDGITEPAITGMLHQRGWAITGPWTNDEWDQWVAPTRRVVPDCNR